MSCNSNVESESEWINLFDGSSASGWLARDGSDLHSGWKIIDGTLTLRKEGTEEDEKIDIIYFGITIGLLALSRQWAFLLFPAYFLLYFFIKSCSIKTRALLTLLSQSS